MKAFSKTQGTELVVKIRQWADELGFDGIGISSTELNESEARLLHWLGEGMHGEMEYMARHGTKRSRPADLVPGTVTIISARMNYFPAEAAAPEQILNDPEKAYIARYALGRDYHKLIRKRLQKLADRIEKEIGPRGYRAFVDSAPVLEKAIAEQAGLGWIGKHTVLINRNAGSWFFLGELYTDLELPESEPASRHCGECRRCIDVCPTQAIVEPYRLDARLCIAYLTIEFKGYIPVELRPLIGNRVFGCDDCQLVCPWNRFAEASSDPAFKTRNRLDRSELLELFLWSEEEFIRYTEGTALRRLGYECWLRNLAVGLGNAPFAGAIVRALRARSTHPSPLVCEHVRWALAKQLKLS